MSNDYVARLVICVVMILSGVLIIWMARATASGRLKRNPVAGIRIPSTMVSEDAWLAAHVRAQRATTYAGIIAVGSGASALLPIPALVLAVVVLVGTGAMLGFVLYGARVGRLAALAITEKDTH
ncbi:MAG: SdpI family protein [Mycetocola sp.]